MDWSRAKNIILILLVIFNVFLLFQIIGYGNEGISKETILNMEKILYSRGIRLECEIPRYDSDTPRLEFGSGVLDKAALAKKLLGIKMEADAVNETGNDAGNDAGNETGIYTAGARKLVFTGTNSFTYTDDMPEDNVDTSDLNETEKYLKKFLKSRNLENPRYVPDEKAFINGKGAVFTYIEKYKGFLIFDNFLKVVVSDKGVTYLEVGQRQIKGFSMEKISDISAAYQILLENFDGSNKAVITSVDLGYKDTANQAQNSLQSSEQLPVWRIKVKGLDSARYFSASDGKEIK